jgi:hypothetical protein
MTTIYDTDEAGNIIVLYDSRWRHPETLGYKPGDPEYSQLQELWEKVTGKRIPKEERCAETGQR